MKCEKGGDNRAPELSRPARGAWVEIKSPSIYTVAPICVAPRKGRVG